MTTQLKDVLARAIEKEIESQMLYLDLSQRIHDSAARTALEELAKQEYGHQNLLEQYRQGKLEKGTLSNEQTIDYKIVEHLGTPEISPEMNLQDIFQLAAIREKASHELYLSLAGIHPIGEVKSIFEELAAQELKHKQKMESLYTDVAFPQTDGG